GLTVGKRPPAERSRILAKTAADVEGEETVAPSGAQPGKTGIAGGADIVELGQHRQGRTTDPGGLVVALISEDPAESGRLVEQTEPVEPSRHGHAADRRGGKAGVIHP